MVSTIGSAEESKMVTIKVTYNGVEAPSGFLDWLDRTEGGVNEYLQRTPILKAGSGNILALIEVALHTKYAEYVGYLVADASRAGDLR